MKTKLLLLSLALTGISFAQTVNNYYSDDDVNFIKLNGEINQSSSGENSTWSINTLTRNDATALIEEYTDTPGRSIKKNYPGITDTLENENTATNVFTTKYFKKDNNALSLLYHAYPENESGEIFIDYNTDNALIGTFPLNYTDPATNDNIAGILTRVTSQGTNEAEYTGTYETKVDATGTLNLIIDNMNPISVTDVTRIKTVQKINFNVVLIENDIENIYPGTSEITSYFYYDNTGANVFRSEDGFLKVPEKEVDEKIINREVSETVYNLSTDNFQLNNNSLLTPNPTSTTLNLELEGSTTLKSLNVLDLNGRTVLLSNTAKNTIDVSALQNGLYILKANTNKGVITKKFVKN